MSVLLERDSVSSTTLALTHVITTTCSDQNLLQSFQALKDKLPILQSPHAPLLVRIPVGYCRDEPMHDHLFGGVLIRRQGVQKRLGDGYSVEDRGRSIHDDSSNISPNPGRFAILPSPLITLVEGGDGTRYHARFWVV